MTLFKLFARLQRHHQLVITMKTMTFIIVAGLVLAGTLNAQLVPLPQVYADMASISQCAKSNVYYAELFAQSLNRTHADTWQLPDDRLAAVLTAFGEAEASARIALQSAMAEALNQGLEAAGSSVRAIVEPGRVFEFVDGVAVLEPLPEPQQPEEPEDEP